MGFATNLMFSNRAINQRSDANFATQRARQSQTNLLRSINPHSNVNALHKADKNIMFASLRAQTNAKIASAMEKQDTNKKLNLLA